LCESYLESDQLNRMEPFYSLHVFVCRNCFLVQLEDALNPEEIFSEYAYFSSHSKGWLKHAEAYAEMIIHRLGLSQRSQVVEVGSNDGYLLQYFVQRSVPVLGVEPATNVAKEAIRKGIPTIVKFFGKNTSTELANQNKFADLIIGNNVIAQVPNLNDFVEGLKILLKPSGVITLEFHHLMKLMDNGQFDTISHERFSYFSFITIEKIFTSYGLTVFDVEELPTHGGSLRIYVRHTENDSIPIAASVNQIREKEKEDGLLEIENYLLFAERVKEAKRDILDFLISAKRNKRSIVGYGAHAEAQTLLNYCGVGLDFLDYTVDRNPVKQGKFVAGVHVPIFHPDKICETRPDYVLVLPWNIKKEIMNQMSHIGEWGGQFIVPIPKVAIYDAGGTEINGEIRLTEVALE
jgi:SAM-dependent methyltransferase